MQQETLFRIVTVILLVSGFGTGMYFRAKAEREGGRLDNKGNKVILALRLVSLIVVWPLIAYLINPNWVLWAQWSAPNWLRWAAAGVALLMVPAIYWLMSNIGQNISPSHTTREGHQLVTTGPYKWIRHPLYTFGFIFVFSLSLVTALWWLSVGMLLPMAGIAWRTPREEQNLIAEFGNEYHEYMKRTGRYFPRLRLFGK